MGQEDRYCLADALVHMQGRSLTLLWEVLRKGVMIDSVCRLGFPSQMVDAAGYSSV